MQISKTALYVLMIAASPQLLSRFKRTHVPLPDSPVPFGYKCAWVAVPACDSAALANALDLKQQRAAGWEEGVEKAYRKHVFVTPPVGGWTLAVGWPLMPSGGRTTREEILPRLLHLSEALGSASFFATHRVIELHVWAKAEAGRLVRGYAYIGESNQTLWNEGPWTAEEVDLGFAFFDETCAEAEDDAYWEREDLSFPTEQSVMGLAGRWSVAPTDLGLHSAEAGLGILGKLP